MSQSASRSHHLPRMPRILIVDDHKFVRETLCKLIKLDEPAWQLSEASDGNEAVEVFGKPYPK